MRKTITMLTIAAGLTVAPATWAQALIDGQVTRVDASAGKITIKHGPMKKFDMEDPMTMVYRAQDPRDAEDREGR